MGTKQLLITPKKRPARAATHGRHADLRQPLDDRPEEFIRAPLLQTLIDLAPDAVLVANAEGDILLVNHQVEVLFGFDRAKLIGRPIAIPLPRYVLPMHISQVGKSLDVVGQRQDGSMFPVEVRLSTANHEDTVLFIVVIRDVTERSRLEAAESGAGVRLRFLRAVLNELPGGAYLVQGPDAALALANRAVHDVWGAVWAERQPMVEFLRQSGVHCFAENGQPLPPEQWVAMQVDSDSQAPRQWRGVVRRGNGTRVPVLLSAVALDPELLGGERHDEEQGAKGSAPLPTRVTLVLVQDMSALQAAEQLKDEFISIAAHELRTPMSAIQGFASMLAVQTELGRGPELADWQMEAITEVHEASKRLNELVNDLLDATRIQAGRLELHPAPLDLIATLRRSLTRLQATTSRHALTLDVEESGHDRQVLLEADGLRLEQVLGNLLGNAIKYSPDGGPVTVMVRPDYTEGHVEVSIHDTGIGIPDDQQARLFQRFARARNVHDRHIAGSGLGLYVCRELIERHGGHIWFKSAEGVGTTFFLSLPMLSALPSDAPQINGQETVHETRQR